MHFCFVANVIFALCWCFATRQNLIKKKIFFFFWVTMVKNNRFPCPEPGKGIGGIRKFFRGCFWWSLIKMENRKNNIDQKFSRKGILSPPWPDLFHHHFISFGSENESARYSNLKETFFWEGSNIFHWSTIFAKIMSSYNPRVHFRFFSRKPGGNEWNPHTFGVIFKINHIFQAGVKFFFRSEREGVGELRGGSA